MKKIFLSSIKYLFMNNFLYRVYVSLPNKFVFTGIEDFSPLTFRRDSRTKFTVIDNNYFSKNKNIPIKFHSFEWLNELKLIGGIDMLKKSRNVISDWCNCNFNFSSNIWTDIIVSRRMMNLSANFEFYGKSADYDFQKKISDLILLHFKHLRFLIYFNSEKSEMDIEISKSILIICKCFNDKKYFHNTIQLIKKQIQRQVNVDGFHKSINTVEHARFIQQLIEIKNILLFHNEKTLAEIDTSINDMTALLKNMFHRDSTLALFNGTNNKKIYYVKKIANLKKDLKEKNLSKVGNGIGVVEAEGIKVFFDITRPNSKLLNKNLHSGTLSFEMSHNKEKIITNCGSPDMYYGKNQIFFRYSAAHSTITINNTNISELSEKNSYKRIPKNIQSNFEELKSHFVLSGSHDGYMNNYKASVKRTLKISKQGASIHGLDQLFSFKNKKKKDSFQIRFHLMPECKCVVTNDNKKIIIKTNNSAWYFESNDSELSIESSIYMGNGENVVQTNQIILSGHIDKLKKEIYWKINKVNE